jgi:hypothetical protein
MGSGRDEPDDAADARSGVAVPRRQKEDEMNTPILKKQLDPAEWVIHPRNAYCMIPLDDDPNGPSCGRTGTRTMLCDGSACVMCEEHAAAYDAEDEGEGFNLMSGNE